MKTGNSANLFGNVAIDRHGAVQLEFGIGGEIKIVQWERTGRGVLESLFDADGAVLRQKLYRGTSAEETRRIPVLLKEFVENENISIIGEKGFSEVKLKKDCPSCGRNELKKDSALAPVLPVYICSSCESKSYHLTDEYLQYLIDNNTERFEQRETSDMLKDRSAFVAELKEYIIRIFASKRIMYIK